jgi:lipid-A-disaccharide synthase
MQTVKNPLVLIIAGEASGDAHGAKLLREIKQIQPDCRFIGIGGKQLQAEGMEIIVHAEQLSIVGISEAVVQLPVILDSLRKVKKTLCEQGPDLVILIDFPDFNFRVAKAAKQHSIKVLYYISPQLWAWRSGRIKTIKRYVDHMAVVFPFEVELYRKEQIPVTFVGHPLAHAVASSMPIENARYAFGLLQDSYTIGLLPGSRQSEIKRLLPAMLQAAYILKQKYPNAQFVLPLALSISQELVMPYIAKLDFKITVVKQRIYDVMKACDVAITASGTVTLEAALMQLPTVVIYKVSWLSYLLGRYLIKIPFISLTNIIAGSQVVPELIQQAANPAAIAQAVSNVLDDPIYCAKIKASLAKVKENLEQSTGDQSVARLAVSLLGSVDNLL